MIGLKNKGVLRGANPLASDAVWCDEARPEAWIGDGDEVKTVMYQCPTCGGRGCTYDTDGTYIKCEPCNGTGQIDS